MTESKATGSIARKINLDFLLHLWTIFFTLDLVLVLLLTAVFFRWTQIEPNQEGWRALLEFFLEIKVPLIILGITELAFLVEGLFGTRKIRRMMRPLNEMAKRTEKLGNITWDASRFSDLEDAISHIRPDVPDANLATGDKDLESLEIAINNLLERMREIYRQQSQFVSDASHELRTPIAVIQGYIHMLDRWGKEDEEILDESIEALKHESEHMKRLVEQLLFLARGDCGRNVLYKEEFFLNEVIKQVCEESEMIEQTHCYCMRAEEPIRMYGDISMIKQSLRIFIENAAKYSAQGSRIEIVAEKRGRNICYSVEDEGNGMNESEVCHVFDRFYRSDDARSSKTGGTGLGLAIAKWIADAHEGEIEVLSRPGIGTRFTVKIPEK